MVRGMTMLMWNEKYRSRFIPTGRIGRKDFAKNLAFILLSAGLLFGMMVSVMENPIFASFGMIYFCFLLWNLFCLIVKRLHDMGYRAWWLLAYWFGGIVVSAIVSLISKSPIVDIMVQGAITIAFYAILLSIKGQPQANKFGEPV